MTWGWGSADAAVALGVVPVAMPFQAYGGDDEGVLPWLRERIEADGTEMPGILPDSQEAPIEAIAAARPDEAEALRADIAAEVQAEADEHPSWRRAARPSTTPSARSGSGS